MWRESDAVSTVKEIAKVTPSSSADASRARGKIVESPVHVDPSPTTGTKSIAASLERQCVSFALKARPLNIRIWRGCFLLFFLSTAAWAVDPHTLVSQYGHTTWRSGDDYVTNPSTISQTTDGYIWIGTSSGLVRFDGAKFTRWSPPPGQSLPSQGIGYLLGSRDGSSVTN
jgi:hypothetical protein